MDDYIVKFFKENKEIINSGEWDKLISKAMEESLGQEPLNDIINYLLKANISLDPNKLLKNFSHKLLNLDTMHQEFYNKYALKDLKKLNHTPFNFFNKRVENDYRFDFKDTNIIDNTPIIGSTLFIVTDGNYVEFGLSLYSDKDHKNLLGTYYFYDHNLEKNLIVLDRIGIGYNEDEIIAATDSLIRGF